MRMPHVRSAVAGLLARVYLLCRLVHVALLLPTSSIPRALDFSAEQLLALLQDALILRRQRSVGRKPRRSAGPGSGEETPVSDDALLSDAAITSDYVGTSDHAGEGDEPPSSRDPVMQHSEASVLAVDIGGTRTKFMLVTGSACKALPPASTADIWQNADLESVDKFEPSTAPRRMQAYLRKCDVGMESVGRLAFSVPGTIDLSKKRADTISAVIKNTPSMSPKFRGFDFKMAFRDVCPAAKVSAIADNLAAALGVACQHKELRSALVVVLGTAPAVATVFRDPSGKGKYIETAIWQSWVWFTKVKLDDPYGYCGGLKVTRDGMTLKPPTAAKIPHHQARIRFALDDATWRRLRGCCDGLPAEMQAHLDEEAATDVWCRRLQASITVLCERFHSIYGPPQEVHVLGGNAPRCHGRVTTVSYSVPESADVRGTASLKQEVPVFIPPDDASQQLMHMSGLVYASCFKLKQVTAPGQDPLARGWTRGGEIYLWVAKGVKAEHDVVWPPIAAVRRELDGAGVNGQRMHTGSGAAVDASGGRKEGQRSFPQSVSAADKMRPGQHEPEAGQSMTPTHARRRARVITLNEGTSGD